MKRILTVLLLTIFAFSYAQSDNRFSEPDDIVEESPVAPPKGEQEINRSPGNPGGRLPINDYIPVLILTAVGIIIYKNYKKKTIV